MQSNINPTAAVGSQVLGGPGPEQPLDLSGVGSRRLSEKIIAAVLFLAGALSIVTTVGIVVVLVSQAITFFVDVPILDFLTGTRWQPGSKNNPGFGVLPLVAGTLIIAGIAIVVALPLGLASAIYLSEYAPERVREILKPAIELLAGIPTIVYGYFALTFMTPQLLKPLIPAIGPLNGLSAAIAVGILIVPLIASLSEDAMRAVPRSLREGAYALGATKLEVASRVVLPAAFSGITAAVILAISVAIGETMIVSLASGAAPTRDGNPLDGMQTMTGAIVAAFSGEPSRGTPQYVSLFAIGLLLFVMTLTLNIVSQVIAGRFREVYE
ncbi:MAG: Phosphate transport system permease protein PstC [uncultured Thermomicrobiales bacterium]|uniref:Phosphate transport system permease protein n=1 Tax=uncultured Thermomicrobiales bacterium TaxID=1645740 RepID=A0A6J4VPM0_9BACT|nr:MAG: Phosphate transport system permease protein PstC [uncultured Thermomicrobiales bacterium]